MEKVKSLVIAILLLTTILLAISYASAIENSETGKTESLSFGFVDPSPGYYETSEFAIGSFGVGIIFPESNGEAEPSTEDWTDEEIQNVKREIQYAFDWWSNQNPNTSLSFINETHVRIPTSYEPINHSTLNKSLWISEVMAYLGYESVHWTFQIRDYVNDLRDRLNTDWALAIFVVDSSNDDDGMFEEGGYAEASPGGPFSYMTYNCSSWGIEQMDRVSAHELGHIFWAIDEYVPIAGYSGYLNVTSIPLSGCLMDNLSWCLSGAPHGHNGTWGQVGWRDSDGDGIQDIVDTFPRIHLNPYERIGNKLNYTGAAAVTPLENKNPSYNWLRRNVTINKIVLIGYRIDYGEWQSATPTDTFNKAIVNFHFLTQDLTPGEHFIEVKATNQWGNSGFANDTVTIPEITRNIAITNITTSRTIVAQGNNTSINVTVSNQGDILESFNVTTYANTTLIQTKNVTLASGNSKTVIFEWNTTGFDKGNYTLSANASILQGETDTEDNTLTDNIITVTIYCDVNGDGWVDMTDIGFACLAYGSHPGHENWNPNIDVTYDSFIDMNDIGYMCLNYGEHHP